MTSYATLRTRERGQRCMTGATGMTEEILLTVKEVADRLRVKPRTIYRMIADGELSAISIRDEYRIRQSELDALIQRRTIDKRKQE